MQEHPELEIHYRHVVEQLALVGVGKTVTRLDLDHNLPLYQHVGAMEADSLTLEEDLDGYLSLDEEPAFRE